MFVCKRKNKKKSIFKLHYKNRRACRGRQLVTCQRLFGTEIMPKVLHVTEEQKLKVLSKKKKLMKVLEAGQIVVNSEAHSFLLLETNGTLFSNMQTQI